MPPSGDRYPSGSIGSAVVMRGVHVGTPVQAQSGLERTQWGTLVTGSSPGAMPTEKHTEEPQPAALGSAFHSPLHGVFDRHGVETEWAITNHRPFPSVIPAQPSGPHPGAPLRHGVDNGILALGTQFHPPAPMGVWMPHGWGLRHTNKKPRPLEPFASHPGQITGRHRSSPTLLDQHKPSARSVTSDTEPVCCVNQAGPASADGHGIRPLWTGG